VTWRAGVFRPAEWALKPDKTAPARLKSAGARGEGFKWSRVGPGELVICPPYLQPPSRHVGNDVVCHHLNRLTIGRLGIARMSDCQLTGSDSLCVLISARVAASELAGAEETSSRTTD
jgi:hypothetical protein